MLARYVYQECSSMVIIIYACTCVVGAIQDSDANTLGRKAKFDEFRSLSAVYHSAKVMPICTGLVIGYKKVLTSCSCISQCESETEAFPETVKALFVVSGNNDADDPQHEVRTVVEIVPHPYCDFAWNGTKADLAVLVLNRGICSCPGSHVLPAQVYRAFQTYFGTPHETCKFSCPNSTYCERDFYNRDDICQVGKVSRVGPCGVLPGSPVYCKGVFWGMYTGHRFCHGNDSQSLQFKGAAMPTIISFYDFYKTHALATIPAESVLYLSLVLQFLICQALKQH